MKVPVLATVAMVELLLSLLWADDVASQAAAATHLRISSYF